MKKAFLAILAAIPALAFAQNPYTIKGKVGNISAPAKVYLQYVVDKKIVTDSATTLNGAFTFTGNVKDITSGSLVLDSKGVGITNIDRKSKIDKVQVYLSAGTITVNGADSLSKSKVSGTKINDDNAVYKVFMKPMIEKQAALNAWYMATPADQRKTKEFTDAMDAKSDALDKENAVLAKAYIKSNSDSYLSLVALGAAGGPYAEYAEVAPYFNGLSAAVKNTTNGKAYAARLERLKLVALGLPAPEFAQADTNGKMVSLSSFKGKYLLVDFWASWCGPCRAENPNLVKTFNKYKDKNFTVMGVSLDQPGAKQKWMDAIHKDGLNWTQVSDLKFWQNDVSTAYGVQAIPQNYLLDPTGKIIGKNLFGKDLDNKLEELFGKI